MTAAILQAYGLREIGTVHIQENRFTMSFVDERALKEERCIYAFLVDEEIVRVGSSKARLSRRMSAWQRDVSAALDGRRSPTPLAEAEQWRQLLAVGEGRIFSRRGTMVNTPIGLVSAYLAEEAALIDRHSPVLCRR